MIHTDTVDVKLLQFGSFIHLIMACIKVFLLVIFFVFSTSASVIEGESFLFLQLKIEWRLNLNFHTQLKIEIYKIIFAVFPCEYYSDPCHQCVFDTVCYCSNSKIIVSLPCDTSKGVFKGNDYYIYDFVFKSRYLQIHLDRAFSTTRCTNHAITKITLY